MRESRVQADRQRQDEDEVVLVVHEYAREVEEVRCGRG